MYFHIAKQYKDFSIDNALMMSESSKLAYQSYDNFINTCESWRFNKKKCLYIEVRNIIVVIFGDSDNIVISFRGTDLMSLDDWVTDIKFFSKKCRYGGGYVHGGFYNALMLVKNAIDDSVKLLRDDNQEIFITGHSMGGALAVLFGHWYATSNIKMPSTVYTFGAPPAGNAEFVKNYPLLCNSFRVVHSNDIVPRTIRTLYDHVGTEYYFNRNSDLLLNPGFFYRMYDHLLSRVFHLRYLGGVRDHSIQLYIDALNKYKNNLWSYGWLSE